MNRKKLAVVAVMLGAIGVSLSGCNNNPQMTNEELNYLVSVRVYESELLEARTDENLIELGHYTCDIIDEGATPNAVIEMVVEHGNLGSDPIAINGVITEALINICPKYAYYLEVG